MVVLFPFVITLHSFLFVIASLERTSDAEENHAKRAAKQ